MRFPSRLETSISARLWRQLALGRELKSEHPSVMISDTELPLSEISKESQPYHPLDMPAPSTYCC